MVKQPNRLMVFVISVMTDLAIVDSIEENHAAHNDLEHWSNSRSAWLDISVLPSPERTTESTSNCSWALVATSQPSAQFRDFHLGEWSVCDKNYEKLKFDNQFMAERLFI